MFVLFSALYFVKKEQPLDKICCIHFWKSLCFVSPCTQTVHNEPRLSFFFFWCVRYRVPVYSVIIRRHRTLHSRPLLWADDSFHICFECVWLVCVFLILHFVHAERVTAAQGKKKTSAWRSQWYSWQPHNNLLVEKSKVAALVRIHCSLFLDAALRVCECTRK